MFIESRVKITQVITNCSHGTVPILYKNKKDRNHKSITYLSFHFLLNHRTTDRPITAFSQNRNICDKSIPN